MTTKLKLIIKLKSADFSSYPVTTLGNVFVGWMVADYDNVTIRSFFIYTYKSNNIIFYKFISRPKITKCLETKISRVVVSYLNSLDKMPPKIFEIELNDSQILLHFLEAEDHKEIIYTGIIYSKMSELRALLTDNFGKEFFENVREYGDSF